MKCRYASVDGGFLLLQVAYDVGMRMVAGVNEAVVERELCRARSAGNEHGECDDGFVIHE